ncbi:PAS domain-containing protein [Streptomyces griseocarneus]|uniref:PAS domain-containing protein n=2 Tax=Streptomyces TaxID=1883 RepID=UPI001F61135A|nr:PAS domain-containing protein [Streptomyces griseocarneus]
MSSRPSRGAARLAAILDALPDALLLVNCNGTVVNANHIALETFEVPGTGLVGRGLLDLLPEFDSRRIPGGLRPPRDDPDGGRTRPTRMIARRTDGTQFPVEVTSANLDGRTPYAEPSASYDDELLMLVVRDLTGTLDTEAELARSQRQTEMILRAAAEGVVGVDTAGKVVLVNPSAAQILGYRASDLGGRELHALIHHSRADGTPFPYEESPIADTLRSGRKHRVRGQVLWAKDGRAVSVDLTTAPVRDGDQLVGAVMTFTDRRPYDALAARHAQLVAMLDESLRGPLDQLRAELGTLADDPAGQLWPEANQILHHLAAGYARVTTLVDNVLAYQRLDAGEDKLAREKVALDEVVAAGVEGAVELIGPGRAQFAVHAPAIEADVDPERFAQALAHLIADVAGVDSTGSTSASASAAAAGSGSVSGDSTIVVAAAQRGEVVRIEVRGPFPGGDPVHGPLVRGIVRRHGGVLQTHDLPGASGGKAYVLEVPVSADAGPVPPSAERRGPDTENLTTVMPMPTQRGRGTSPVAPAPEPARPQGGGRRARRPEAPGGAGTGVGSGVGGGAGASAGAGAEGAATTAGTPSGTRAGTNGVGMPSGTHAPGTNGMGMPSGTHAGTNGVGMPTGTHAGTNGVGMPTGTHAGTNGVGIPSDAHAPGTNSTGMPTGPHPGTSGTGIPSGTHAGTNGVGMPAGAAAAAAADASPGAAPVAAPVAAPQPTGRRRGPPAPRRSPPTTREAAVRGPAWCRRRPPGPRPPAVGRAVRPRRPPRPRAPRRSAPRSRCLRPTPTGPRARPPTPAVRRAARAARWPRRSTRTRSPARRPTNRPCRAPRSPCPRRTATARRRRTAPPRLSPPLRLRFRRRAGHGFARGPGYGHRCGGGRRRPRRPVSRNARPHGPGSGCRRPVRPAGPRAGEHLPGHDRPRRSRRAERPGRPGPYNQHGPRPEGSGPAAAAVPGAPAGQAGPGTTGRQGPDGGPTATPAPAGPAGRNGSDAPTGPAATGGQGGPGAPAPFALHGPRPEGGPAGQVPGARPAGDASPSGGAPTGQGRADASAGTTPAHGTPVPHPAPAGDNAPNAAGGGQGAPESESAQAQAADVPTGRRRARRALAEEPGAAAPAAGAAAAEGPRPISVRALGQRPGTSDTPPGGTPTSGSGRRRKLANPAEGEREAQAQAQAAAAAAGPVRPQPHSHPHPQPSLGAPEVRAFAIGAPDEGAEGPEPLDGPNSAVEVVEAVRPPMDDELPPEPLDNPRRLLVWPAPDESTEKALTERGYRPVIVQSREEVDEQISAYPAALFVDPLTGPITRAALRSLREAAGAAEVPVLLAAGLGHATREAAYGADPALLLKALAPRDSEMHPPRVLLVEEHEPIANALTATLERHGMHVVCGATDSEAVTLAAQTSPNLVVMDLMQVRRRRAGIVDWLRGNGALSRTPLVVYTSADIDPSQLPRLASGETVLFLAERSTSAEVQGRIVDLLAKIGTN